jgi:hypothetical protein
MSVPSGPYIPQVYNASDPDVKVSDMQAALEFAVFSFSTTDTRGYNSIAIEDGGSQGARIRIESNNQELSRSQTIFELNNEDGITLQSGVLTLNAAAYTIVNPSVFRNSIGVYETFGEYMETVAAQTTDPGVSGQPWNSGGFFKFSTGGVLTFLRPDGIAQYNRPDGTSIYQRA